MMQPARFEDRFEAGRRLAAPLARHRGSDAVVLALPRGGVPVAYEVARALGLPLDVYVVRKLGLPSQPELAMGAIAGSTRVLNEEVMRAGGVDEETLERVTARETAELERQEHAYRAGREPIQLDGRRAILVDDGLATGSTMLAAVRALRAEGASAVTAAVPVAPPPPCRSLAREADELVCLRTPSVFFSVGGWYEDFGETSDGQVRRLLEEASSARVSSERPLRSA